MQIETHIAILALGYLTTFCILLFQWCKDGDCIYDEQAPEAPGNLGKSIILLFNLEYLIQRESYSIIWNSISIEHAYIC